VSVAGEAGGPKNVEGEAHTPKKSTKAGDLTFGEGDNPRRHTFAMQLGDGEAPPL
jgi:hypothetical protein